MGQFESPSAWPALPTRARVTSSVQHKAPETPSRYAPARQPLSLVRTNAFSRTAENHAHAIAIYFMPYNFLRMRQSLRATSAKAEKVTDRLWDVDDMVKVSRAWKARQCTRCLA